MMFNYYWLQKGCQSAFEEFVCVADWPEVSSGRHLVGGLFGALDRVNYIALLERVIDDYIWQHFFYYFN